MSQGDGDLDIVLACQLLVVVLRSQKRKNGLFQYFCLAESCPLSSCHLEVRQFSSFLYVSGAFQAAISVLELGGSSLRLSVGCGPLRTSFLEDKFSMDQLRWGGEDRRKSSGSNTSKALLAHPLLTSFCASWFLTGSYGTILVHVGG